ncbi:hypothetical protein EDB89DRAFT_544141 [Lactarius sanguifluus]|nr:hypothetical protein EDB89DRAFT_544141 [Lactarius sanguifluus]
MAQVLLDESFQRALRRETCWCRVFPGVKDENDVAAQLVGFLQQFLEIFSELKGKKSYPTGSSYAGIHCELHF